MFAWLFQSKRRLNEVELAVVDAIANALPEVAASILRNQVRLINHIRRFDEDRDVNMWHLVRGKSAFPSEALFPNRGEEVEIAKVKVVDEETGHGTTAKVKLVRGHLFAIEFNPTPRDLLGSKSLRTEVTNIDDPMIPSQ